MTKFDKEFISQIERAIKDLENTTIVDPSANCHMSETRYKNTQKYYSDRRIFLLNNDYHCHRARMYLVDCEFKNSSRSYLSYQNILHAATNNNINVIYINQQNEQEMMMEYSVLYNISLDTHMKSGIGNFIKYLKTK